MVKALLVVAGVVAVAIGAAVLLTPVAFSASYGIVLGVDSDALSERRGLTGDRENCTLSASSFGKRHLGCVQTGRCVSPKRLVLTVRVASRGASLTRRMRVASIAQTPADARGDHCGPSRIRRDL